MKITSLIIVILLAGCRAPQFKTPAVRRIWSVQFDTCYCQPYDINNIKPLADVVPCDEYFKTDISTNQEYCDDLVGFSAQVWAEDITPIGKALKRWSANNCE